MGEVRTCIIACIGEFRGCIIACVCEFRRYIIGRQIHMAARFRICIIVCIKEFRICTIAYIKSAGNAERLEHVCPTSQLPTSTLPTSRTPTSKACQLPTAPSQIPPLGLQIELLRTRPQGVAVPKIALKCHKNRGETLPLPFQASRSADY